MKKKIYESDFKVRVVLESLQRDTTIEQVRNKYQVATSLVNKWRSVFRKNAHLVLEIKKPAKPKPNQNPEDIKKKSAN